MNTTTASVTEMIPAQRPPMEQRGRTAIPERVVAKIATRAADETETTRTGAGGALPLFAAAKGSRAQAHRSGASVMLSLSIAVGYPVPVRQATREVRRHVQDTVERLTGLRVRHTDIEVTELVREGDRGRERHLR
ncbi:Asp23/Gls24 family envelope stress response protein [Salinactinospora qingdaonensis]|uniref:Asp23 family, cell envelope-related function n=1 Tax=Salinactinospora qingdaonensis TaxID=702744 RepID=A0ABP7GKS7_9ACTN